MVTIDDCHSSAIYSLINIIHEIQREPFIGHYIRTIEFSPEDNQFQSDDIEEHSERKCDFEFLLPQY